MSRAKPIDELAARRAAKQAAESIRPMTVTEALTEANDIAMSTVFACSDQLLIDGPALYDDMSRLWQLLDALLEAAEHQRGVL